MGKQADHDRPESLEETGAADDTVVRRALVWSTAVISVLAAAVTGGVIWLNRTPPVTVTAQTELIKPAKRELPPLEIPTVGFTDITRAAGIHFTRISGARGDKLLPETMGGGCAFFDYDADGDPDILLVNGCDWPWTPDKTSPQPTMGLYQNDGRGKFSDVTAEAGLGVTFYGTGVAVGDYDNDGWRDVFISAVGRDHLFHNERGRFV
ncbi:MAG: VCBS repeat-containing protein, partial [Pirellulaceae bacterium]|nr:VCBS repeat-containing protein [Pirellulaceae bacterium]